MVVEVVRQRPFKEDVDRRDVPICGPRVGTAQVKCAGPGGPLGVQRLQKRGDTALGGLHLAVDVEVNQGEGERSAQGIDHGNQLGRVEVRDGTDELETRDLIHQLEQVQAGESARIAPVHRNDPQVAGAWERLRAPSLAAPEPYRIPRCALALQVAR